MRQPLEACRAEKTQDRRASGYVIRGLMLAALVLTGLVPSLAAARTALYPPPMPGELLLTVRETAGIARDGEVVRSGVPLPRALDLRSPDALAVVDDAGNPVPAEFQILARWDAGLATDAPVQWLLVTFPAAVPANGSVTYRIVTDGSAGPAPAPANPVRISQDGDQISVETGAATFVVGGDPGTLFDAIRLPNGASLVDGGALTARVSGTDVTHPTTRRVVVEHAGPLTAIVVVEGLYDRPPVGNGALSSRRRYVFTAGSPTANVRHAVTWEGDLCPPDGWDLACDGDGDGAAEVNALLVERVRNALALEPAAAKEILAVGDFEAAAVEGAIAAGDEAWVRQQLRATRTDPLTFDLNVPGSGGSTGDQADGGMLAATGPSGAVAVALNRMHRYEPQALRLLGDGHLAVDVVDDTVWLGQRQGLFATLAVSVSPSPPSRVDLDRLLWAPLNHPLHAWAEPAWFAASDAVDEFPVGPLPAALAGYDALMASTLATTRQQVDDKGLAGLMTFGVYPRLWGNPIYSDEIDCGPDEPTPTETWDNTYWCGAWTDYHNTVAAVPVWAMRSGEVQWLDDLAFPGALRVLHTQIMQCAPEDPYFYCGQAPAGYGGYRLDFNSSHAYFDNLMLYYWLTGDYTVVETLERGAGTMRLFLCSRRPAESCQPDDPPSDFWAQLSGRVAVQWFSVFRFVGLAGADAGYLDDYRSGVARAVTQHYVEVEQGGTRYGFWTSGGDVIDGPGADGTDALWAASLYDMTILHRLLRDTNDTPIGNPAIPPSQVLTAWARTLVAFGATTAGDGTAGGAWPSALNFRWSGERIGGAVISVTANTGGDDPNLYDTGKAALTAVLVWAGQQTNDPALTQMGEEMTLLTIGSAQASGVPLGKEMGEYLSRLHAAVARLAAGMIEADAQDRVPDVVAAVGGGNSSIEAGNRRKRAAKQWKPWLIGAGDVK